MALVLDYAVFTEYVSFNFFSVYYIAHETNFKLMKLLQKQYIEYLLFVVKNKTSNNLINFVYFLWFVYFSSFKKKKIYHFNILMSVF